MTETRARRRIRQAVESRGYRIESIDYEPWYNAGEMMGIGGGWSIELDRDFLEHTHPGNDMYALSVEELLAQIDYWIKPATPCDCDRSHDPMAAARVKNDPCKPTHGPECPHHLKYRLPWWPRAVVSEGETHPEPLSAPVPSPGGTHTNLTDSGAPRAAGAAETTQGQQP